MTKILLTYVCIFFLALPLFAQEIDTAWVRSYSGCGAWENIPNAIAVDDSGNVYLTGGGYVDTVTRCDYITIKYYPNGDTVWMRSYHTPGLPLPEYSSDWAYDIAVDNSGNVFVTGFSFGIGTYSDYATIKYYPNGDTAWVRRYNGPTNSTDQAYALTIDDSSNVYVTGISFGGVTYSDYVTVKYDSNGDTAWVRRYNGPGNKQDTANAIAVDDSGYVYVTGVSYARSTSCDYVTIKYYPNGDTVWLRRYDGQGNGKDSPTAMVIDDSGDVCVTGYSMGSGTSYDYATIKYYSNGDIAWVRRYYEPGNYEDLAYAIAIDDTGNVYVTGTSYNNKTKYDYVTIKYTPDGDTVWMRRYNAPSNFYDIASSIAVDDSGNVYVAGSSDGRGTGRDYATIKYNSNGDELWVSRHNGPENADDYANDIAVDNSGNVYVTGTHSFWGDHTTIKYNKVLFYRGDVNRDEMISVFDCVYLICYLYKSGPAPYPLTSGDVDCDGQVSLLDIIFLISYLFKDGLAPFC